MPRREFPKAVKVAVIKRATHGLQVRCEACGTDTKGVWQIDHVRPDGLLGEPTLANAQLLCRACYAPKNAKDTKDIAQAKRREARHIGAHTPKAIIPVRPKAERPAKDKLPMPPRRPLWITLDNPKGAD